ncbi:hypothetical protein HNR65_003473 [Desulfosalsimonas propionicica]|uniref:Uncharacterized protein n=1 Tax=Desulfosalsimonas propionicica TaxID=332175 RepID=A0A7W0HMI0_9BACT|nr:hypothetical protein [Desulfosalsimonas propionicica]MBA2883116.1 hypothetical protein [Desulfosalsimonas propionicica]
MRDPSPFLANLRISRTAKYAAFFEIAQALILNCLRHHLKSDFDEGINVYLRKIRSAGQDPAGTMHLIGEHLSPKILLGTLLFVLTVSKKQLIKVLDIWSDCARGSNRERMRLLSGIADIMGNTIENIKLHRQSLVEKKDHFFGSVNFGMQSQSGPAKKTGSSGRCRDRLKFPDS